MSEFQTLLNKRNIFFLSFSEAAWGNILIFHHKENNNILNNLLNKRILLVKSAKCQFWMFDPKTILSHHLKIRESKNEKMKKKKW